MMSASCGTEIASMHAAVGEKIVGRQRNAGGRTDGFIYMMIKTHGSESRGQEEAAVRDERVSYLHVALL